MKLSSNLAPHIYSNQEILRGAIYGIILANLLILSILFIFLYAARRKALLFTKNLFSKRDAYFPTSGDLILLQYESSGMREYPQSVQRIPTHCGIVVIFDSIPYVLEATRFPKPFMRDYLRNYAANDGIRLVLLSSLIASVDTFCLVRPLISGNVQIKKSLFPWLRTFRFEPSISDNMSIAAIAALGFGPFFPTLGKIASFASGLNSSDRRAVFCSEFISILLQKLGHLPPYYNSHYLMAPINLSHSMGTIDELSKRSSKPLMWGPEIILKERYGK